MKFFFKKNKKYFLTFLDALLIAFSYYFVIFIIRQDFLEVFISTQAIGSIAVAIFVYISILYMLNIYKHIWIYAGVWEYFYCLFGCFLSMIVTGTIAIGLSEYLLSIKYQIASGIFASVFIIGYRALIKLLFYYLRSHIKANDLDKKNLLIIGAGEAGSLLVREILRKPEEAYNIVGLIDDDILKTGCLISGIRVIGTRNDIIEVCKTYNVKEIILAIPSIDNYNKKDILKICSATNCKVRILPNSLSMLDRVKLKTDIRDVQVEDLLSRDVINLDNKRISKDISKKVILVTGGGGSIGSELCRQIATYSPSKLIILDAYENNAFEIQNELKADYPDLNLDVIIASVRDKVRMDSVFNKYRPDIVFHAAAHKHVPLMENCAGEAIKNNVVGTLNVCECAHKYNTEKFILISSDKAVNPTNVMGATKRICEMIIQSIDKISQTEFVAVRFGNVLGSNGSVIPTFKKQIERGGPVTLTHRDITRYFMTIPEATQLVLEAVSYANGGEIFVLDMGEPVKIYDLAVNLIKLAGYEVDKDIKIKIVGLRPGEKLYEELLTKEEGLTETLNKKIFIAKPSDIDFEALKLKIYKLYSIADKDNNLIKEIIKELVPNYKENKRINKIVSEEDLSMGSYKVELNYK